MFLPPKTGVSLDLPFFRPARPSGRSPRHHGFGSKAAGPAAADSRVIYIHNPKAAAVLLGFLGVVVMFSKNIGFLRGPFIYI